MVGNGLFGYTAEGRCQAFELISVFVGQDYDEIFIILRGLVLGGNSEGLCFDGYSRSMHCKLQSCVNISEHSVCTVPLLHITSSGLLLSLY